MEGPMRRQNKNRLYAGVAAALLFAIGGTAVGLHISKSSTGGGSVESAMTSSSLTGSYIADTDGSNLSDSLQLIISGKVTFTGAEGIAFNGLPTPDVLAVDIAVPDKPNPKNDGAYGENYSGKWPRTDVDPTCASQHDLPEAQRAPVCLEPLIGATVTGIAGIDYNVFDLVKIPTGTKDVQIAGLDVAYKPADSTSTAEKITSVLGFEYFCAVTEVPNVQSQDASCPGQAKQYNDFVKAYDK
jgi:hypothetical protein